MDDLLQRAGLGLHRALDDLEIADPLLEHVEGLTIAHLLELHLPEEA